MYTYSIAIYNDNEQWEYMCSVSHRAHLSAVLPHRSKGCESACGPRFSPGHLGPLSCVATQARCVIYSC